MLSCPFFSWCCRVFFQTFGWGCCGVAFSSLLLGGVVLSLLLLVLPVCCVSLGGGGFFPLSKWVKWSSRGGVVFQFLPFLVVLLFWWCFFPLLFCLVGSVVLNSLVSQNTVLNSRTPSVRWCCFSSTSSGWCCRCSFTIWYGTKWNNATRCN